MVFFVDWAGWYVIIFFISISFLFFSSLPLLLLFLSFGGGFVETNTTKNKKSYFFLWKKLKLTDDFPFSGTELSLTVPITNSLAFLFTVLGEWWADGKVISRGKLHTYLYIPSILSILSIHVSAGQEGGSQLQDFRSVTRCICYDESGASCNGDYD